MIQTVNVDEKLLVPHALKMKILKIQVDEDCDWSTACMKAAAMLDQDQFNQMVEAEVSRRENGEVLIRVNKMRDSIREKAKEEVRSNEDNFRVPCHKCGNFMHFSNRDSNWATKIQPALNEAFKNWGHVKC